MKYMASLRAPMYCTVQYTDSVYIDANAHKHASRCLLLGQMYIVHALHCYWINNIDGTYEFHYGRLTMAMEQWWTTFGDVKPFFIHRPYHRASQSFSMSIRLLQFSSLANNTFYQCCLLFYANHNMANLNFDILIQFCFGFH